MHQVIEFLLFQIETWGMFVDKVTEYCERIAGIGLATHLKTGLIGNGQIELMLFIFGLQQLPTRYGAFQMTSRRPCLLKDALPTLSSPNSPAQMLSEIDTSQPHLPWEIIDEILISLGNPKLAISLQRFAIVRRIDSSYDSNWAIKRGFLKYLKYLNCKNHCKVYDLKSIRYCATEGDLKVLKYCHEYVCPITEYSDLLDRAAWFGHLELVKYLHSIGSKCTTDAMDGAAEEGHLEIVKFLDENRSEGCTNYAMDRACFWGLLNVVEYLHYNRTEGCSAKAMEYALRHNQAEVVEWFRKNKKEAQIYFDRIMIQNVEILRLSNCSITIGMDKLKVYWILLE
jgi:hypothetical protein